jgi:centrosomal protein CEP19
MLYIAEVDYQNLNLNKLTTEEIARHKKKMDKVFDKNFVKPNDPNFVYDKRTQFKPPAKVDVEDSWE